MWAVLLSARAMAFSGSGYGDYGARPLIAGEVNTFSHDAFEFVHFTLSPDDSDDTHFSLRHLDSPSRDRGTLEMSP